MSSIRPLATVTVLICVGVALWMTINETEPALPEELGDWPVGAELEVGDEASFAAENPLRIAPPASAAEADEAPPFAASPGSQAPAFQPGAASAAARTAPAWNGSPVGADSVADDSVAAGPADDDQAVVNPADSARPTPGVPEMPQSVDPSTSAASSGGASDYRSVVSETESAPQPPSGAESPVTPTPQTSLFTATRIAVQSALDRGELAQALLLLSDWYDDPVLTSEERAEVKTLLSQLAGTVIYSREPRLEAPYIVQSGETLSDVAAKYNVPAALLAKINGVADPNVLEPGSQLKVVRGPFSAIVDVSDREMTLMLDHRYAGRFDIDIEPDFSVEDGQWLVDQKQIAPAGGYDAAASVDRSLVLANPASGGGQVAVMRGMRAAADVAAGPGHRAIRLKSTDIGDVFDILSVGSRVTIRR